MRYLPHRARQLGRKLWGTLYFRICALFLVLLTLLAGLQIALFTRASTRFLSEADQRLNRTVAAYLAVRFQPLLSPGLNAKAARELMHDIQAFNPRIDIYIVDRAGEVRVSPPEKQTNGVILDLRPIKRFLGEGDKAFPILGDDPRNIRNQKPFSVYPLMIEGKPGYLYVVIRSDDYDLASSSVATSYVLRNVVSILFITVSCTALIGFLSFFFLTKRFRVITKIVRAFARGNFSERLPQHGDEEIGELSGAINKLADTIVAQISTLNDQDRLRRELVANISHDLKGPVASMRGYIDMVLTRLDTLSEVERRQYLQVISRNTDHLARLVESVFELARIEAITEELRMEPLSLTDLAGDVATKLAPQAAAAKVTFTLAVPELLPRAAGDVEMLERVFSNVMENAIKYAPGSTVTISIVQRGTMLVTTIRDGGPGIASADLPHVFERFYRAEQGRTKGSGGAGLGLAIVKRTVELHNGKAAIRSAPGAGTEIEFTLPIAGSVRTSPPQKRAA